MKHSGWPFLVVSLFLLIVGCAPKQSDIVVLEVGTQKVSLAEYEDFFTRNSGGWDAAKQSTLEERERFLDLLTNYKLKLTYAYEHNLQSDPEIVKELAEYRTSLASTFLIDREITDPGVKQLFARRAEEIRAQHILIATRPDASPEDTAKAFQRANDVLNRVNSGANFDSLTLAISEDPTAKSNKGDVYYFSAGQMTPLFENAAYSMKKGEISKTPVRTPFGYHIIRILDRQPAHGSIKASHIMARFMVSATDSADTAKALQRIMGFQDSLKKGWKFSELATKLSEDPGSAPNGGSLGWFERRRWVLQFDEAVFKLHPGETSGIVRTPYGYHIIHCDSVKALPTFAESQEDLKSRYKQIRYNDDYNSFITNLKKTYAFNFNEPAFDRFITGLDTLQSTEDSAWTDEVPASVKAMTMFTVNGKGTTVDNIASKLSTSQEFRGIPLRKKDLRPVVDKLSERALLEERTVGLEAQYPEFASLMKEYRDGVVLFKAEQNEVWNKVSVSDSVLKNYFSQHNDKFMFPARVDYDEIRVESDTLALMIYDSLTHGASFSELAARYNDDPELRSKHGAHGFQPADTTDDLAQLASTLAIGEISDPHELEAGGYVIVRLNAKEPARPKTFEEAGAEVSNSFQEYESKRLEREWLERAKAQHTVIQYKEKLKDAFTKTRAQ